MGTLQADFRQSQLTPKPRTPDRGLGDMRNFLNTIQFTCRNRAWMIHSTDAKSVLGVFSLMSSVCYCKTNLVLRAGRGPRLPTGCSLGEDTAIQS